MTKPIKKVAVIGAGAMGSGIAGQCTNAGFDVVLLDKFDTAFEKNPETGEEPPFLKMQKATVMTDPFNANLMDLDNIKRIKTGTIDDNIDMIADADLVIEAVYERLDIKQDTFRLIEEHAPADAIITSNTSTIPIETLVEGFSDAFKKRFMNTHFFNPPRIMRLLELIAGKDTDPDIVQNLADIGDRFLGKKVVMSKDTPGFIGNRIGTFAMYRALAEAKETGVKVEDVNSIMSAAFGFPKQGMMKLADMVGIDIVYHVGQNLHTGLSDDDEFQSYFDGDLLKTMIDEGHTGNKGDGGFFRKKKEDGRLVTDKKGKPLKQVRDLVTGEYRDEVPSDFFKMRIKGSFSEFFDSGKPAAKFAWPVLRDTFLYVLNHADDIAFDVQSVDDAMKTGYNWKWGPFELVDKCGAKWFAERLKKDGIEVPPLLQKAIDNGGKFYNQDGTQQTQISLKPDQQVEPLTREDGVVKLDDFKKAGKPLIKHKSASLWDIGDGVVCLEFTSKMNSLDPSTLYVLNQSLKLVEGSKGKYKAMVIYNDGSNFSVGANLGLIAVFNRVVHHPITRALGLSGFLDRKLTNFVEEFVFQGQAVYKAMREAPFPVIAAPKGMALGGGCEIIMHADAIQSGAELYTGLVEAGVGLIPGWGGCARYLERAQEAVKGAGYPAGPMQALQKAALAIAMPQNALSTSAQDAKKKLWLRPHDRISMNEDRILADAKSYAIEMSHDYTPPKPAVYHLPGASGKASIRMLVDDMYLRNDDPAKGVNHIDVQVLTGGEEIKAEDMDYAVDGDSANLQKIAAERESGSVRTHESIPITEERILQLEREQFMALFRTNATKSRINHMIATNKPKREKWDDSKGIRPAPFELREQLEEASLPVRVADGRPLEDGKLEGMASMTSRVLGFAQKLGLM